MVDITFYTFSKKQNSTSIPASSSGVSKQCLFLEPTDMLAPSITINEATAPVGYNYCYIPTFSRYYFINDWTYQAPYWIASLNVDVLASWKTNIGNSEQYVLRSTYEDDGSTKIFNPDIVDTQYPATGEFSILNGEMSAEYPISWRADLDDGTYVVGILNGDANAIGSVSYYVFTPANFNTFKQYLTSSTFYNTISRDDTDVLDIDEGGQGTLVQTLNRQVSKSLIDPFKYVVSCLWFPFSAPTSGSQLSSINVGWWTISSHVSCYRLSNKRYHTNVLFTIPNHPQLTRGNYLNLSPYRRLSLYFYGWGEIPIDATKLPSGTIGLGAQVNVDCITGTGILDIGGKTTDSFEQIARLTTQVGVEIQMAQLSGGLAGTLVSAYANIDTSPSKMQWVNKLGDKMQNALSQLGSTITAMYTNVSTMGSNGSIAPYYKTPELIAYCTNIADEHFDHIGRPLCEEKDIDELSGYMVIGDADINFPCTDTEKTELKSLMEGGFFYE